MKETSNKQGNRYFQIEERTVEKVRQDAGTENDGRTCAGGPLRQEKYQDGPPRVDRNTKRADGSSV